MDDALYLRVAQLRLRLSLKLRFRHFDTDDSRESLADVLSRERDFRIFEKPARPGVTVKRPRDCTLKAALMEAPRRRADVIRVREDVFRISRVKLQRHLYRDTLTNRLHINRLPVQHLFILVVITHKRSDAARIVEDFRRIRPVITRLTTLIVKADAHPFIQKRQFPKPVAEHLV